MALIRFVVEGLLYKGNPLGDKGFILRHPGNSVFVIYREKEISLFRVGRCT